MGLPALSGTRPLIIVVGLALALRLPGLASKPLWYDEAFAILFSDQGLQAMAAGTLSTEEGVAADVHPLAYYTALWGWGDLFGTAPTAARLLSVLIGLVVVILGYLFSRRLFDARVALISGLLLAISPFQIHYAQEIRMYALLAGLLLTATWLYWEALETGRSVYWVGVAVLSAGALYTHNLASLYLLPLMITPALLGRWREAAKSLLAAIGTLILYLPWLVGLPSQVARVHATYWIDVPGPAEVVNTYMTFTSGLPVPDLALPLALFLGILLGIIAALGTFRGIREGAEGSRRALWLAYLAFAPVALMFVV
ncbi:MAG: glycosyltransferase family 39 protein, partial [Anaerolineales bacterium]